MKFSLGACLFGVLSKAICVRVLFLGTFFLSVAKTWANPVMADYEGVYRLEFVCEQDELCQKSTAEIQRLSLIRVGSQNSEQKSLRFLVSFSNLQVGSLYRFFNVAFDQEQKKFSGKNPENIFASFEMFYDFKTGTFSGRLKSLALERPYFFRAHPIQSVFVLRNQKGPFQEVDSNLRGQYRGRWGSSWGKIRIRNLSVEDGFGGLFVFDPPSDLTFVFREGRVGPMRGEFSMISEFQGHVIKAFLGRRAESWTGFSVSVFFGKELSFELFP